MFRSPARHRIARQVPVVGEDAVARVAAEVGRVESVVVDHRAAEVGGVEAHARGLDSRSRRGNPAWPALKESLRVSVSEGDWLNSRHFELKKNRVLANDIQ